MRRIKTVGESGSPCLAPLFMAKKELQKLLFVIQQLGFLYIILINGIKKFPKPQDFSIAKMKDQFKESKALCKSTDNTAPGAFL